MTKPTYRDELMAFRAATSQRPPHIQLPADLETVPTMKPLTFFTPLRLATIAALLVIGTSSAFALSPALRNFFLDFGLTADERAEQTQQQLDENGIAGTATPTSTGAVHVATDGANGVRLLQLLQSLTVVTPTGETAEVPPGLQDVISDLPIAEASKVKVTIASTVTQLNTPPASPIVIKTDDATGLTGDALRDKLKERGLPNDIIDEVVRQYLAQHGK